MSPSFLPLTTTLKSVSSGSWPETALPKGSDKFPLVLAIRVGIDRLKENGAKKSVGMAKNLLDAVVTPVAFLRNRLS